MLEEPDTLTDIDIYFPTVGNRNSAPITLFVWSKLEGEEEVVLRKQNTAVFAPTNVDALTTFKLDTTIITVISDTFYIGYQQQGNDFLAVGLDKNTNSGDKMFFNVTGTWEQNTDVQGSLMMRPRFKNNVPIVTGIDDPEKIYKPENVLNVYPNPNLGQFQVKGIFSGLIVRDIVGKEIPFALSKVDSTLHEISLLSARPGIYLVSFTTKQGLENHRILVR